MSTRIPTLEDIFQGEEPECSCCQSFGIPLKICPLARLSPTYEDNADSGLPQFRALCDLCAGTQVGTWAEYYNQHSDDLELGKIICYVGNEILKAISGMKQS